MRHWLNHPWGWTSLPPILCAAHCALTPAIVVVAPAVVADKAVEWALLAGTLVLAATALASGARAHRTRTPALLATTGMGLWAASLAHWLSPIPESLTTVGAAMVVALALLWNAKLHCRHRATACQACATHAPASTEPRAGGSAPRMLTSDAARVPLELARDL